MVLCRCNSEIYIDTPTHDGQSTRRDCATCGKTWGFPKWLGVVDESMTFGRAADRGEVKEAEARIRKEDAFAASQTQRKKRAAAAKRARELEQLEA